MTTKKQPWISFPEIWKTEAQFITWVRGVLRRGWKVHPVKLEYLTSRKHKIVNNNPKSKKTHPKVWGWVCEQCNEEVTKVEIDHAGTVQGKFTSMDEIQGYAEHLFLVDFDSLQCICVPCHKTRTLAQKKGMSFEDARIEQEVIRIMKLPAKSINDALLREGYSPEDFKNSVKRKQCVQKELKLGNQFL